MKQFAIPYVMLILICLSCSKGTDPVVLIQENCFPYSEPTTRIKETTVFSLYNNKFGKSTYFYDSFNRLRRRCDSGSYYNEVLWKYDKDKVYLMRPDSSILSYFNVNSQNLAVDPSIGMYHWEYDSAGYLIKETLTVSGLGTQISNYYKKCWNLNYELTTSLDENGIPNPEGGKITYEYYPERLNTIGNENMGIGYFGKQNNCLLKYRISHYKTLIDTIESNLYEFDSLNRVSKETKKISGTTRISTFKYYE